MKADCQDDLYGVTARTMWETASSLGVLRHASR